MATSDSADWVFRVVRKQEEGWSWSFKIKFLAPPPEPQSWDSAGLQSLFRCSTVSVVSDSVLVPDGTMWNFKMKNWTRTRTSNKQIKLKPTQRDGKKKFFLITFLLFCININYLLKHFRMEMCKTDEWWPKRTCRFWQNPHGSKSVPGFLQSTEQMFLICEKLNPSAGLKFLVFKSDLRWFMGPRTRTRRVPSGSVWHGVSSIFFSLTFRPSTELGLLRLQKEEPGRSP